MRFADKLTQQYSSSLNPTNIKTTLIKSILKPGVASNSSSFQRQLHSTTLSTSPNPTGSSRPRGFLKPVRPVSNPSSRLKHTATTMEAWGVFQDSFVKPAKVKIPDFPGFTAVNDQVFYRSPETSQPPPPDHPTDLILFAWGDALPKHAVKYADGYRALFPQTKQIVVLAPIHKALHSDTPTRTRDMMPIVHTLFPQSAAASAAAKASLEAPLGDGAEEIVQNLPETEQEDHSDRRILCQAMSNTGGINYVAMLNAYLAIYGRPLQHHLACFDSTPGTTVLTWANLQRWSNAMAMGTAKWFPWPYVVTQAIWGSTILANRAWETITAKDSAAPWSQRATMDVDFCPVSTRRLYLYSKEDELISWEDVQGFSDQSESLGWQVEREMFVGSGHVGHMRMHPEQYWAAVKGAWERALEQHKQKE